jgi:hypothetical protein
LVEHFDGRMEILHWPDEIARRQAERPTAAEARIELPAGA